MDDDASIRDWRYVHNLIKPGDVPFLDDIRAEQPLALWSSAPCVGFHAPEVASVSSAGVP
ncbi:hypothetical protein [Streptomyces sp. NPDC056921]|uniref:hypothetical protein n=1 Tax=Streptomyces sp. NPDC056921 TaxID=3345966 RepID=UPI00362A825D